jgi:hypothetical protein
LWLAGSTGLSYSTDGLLWHTVDSPFDSFVDIIYGNKLWVASGVKDMQNRLAYSEDGFTWTYDIVSTSPVKNISYNRYSTDWLARNDVDILYSSNGKEWLDTTPPFDVNTISAWDRLFLIGGNGCMAIVEVKGIGIEIWSVHEIDMNCQAIATDEEGDGFAGGLLSVGGTNLITIIHTSIERTGRIPNMINVLSIVWFGAANIWIAGGSGPVILAISHGETKTWDSVVLPFERCVALYVRDIHVFAKFVDGTTYKYRYSSDGINWSTSFSGVIACAKHVLIK